MARRRVWLVAIVATGLVIALAGIAGGWTLLRARPVQADLTRAGGLLLDLQADLDRADLAAARRDLAALQAATTDARSASAGWDWRLATAVPGVGADLAAAATVAAVLDDLSQQALPALVDLAGQPLVRAGAVDVAALAGLADLLTIATAVVVASAAQIAGIAPDELSAGLRDGVDRLRAGLDRLVAVVTAAGQAATLLPAMLGLAGPRTYLVLLQNLAESRATGGMPGAFMVIRADHGGLSLVDAGATGTVLGTFGIPVQRLTANQLTLYTDRPAVFPADVNLTPDFATTAVLAREMYRRRTGRTVDGVLATDPVALSYLLAVTGPVSVR
jgi:hypothetical protein